MQGPIYLKYTNSS